MRSILFLTSMLFFMACGQNDSGSTPAVAGAGDFSGYQLSDYSGGNIQKATKADGEGKALEEGTIVNGQRTGTWLTFHPLDANERIKTITTYINGMKNGVYMEINNNGQVIVQCYYNNDQLDGLYSKFKFGSRREKQLSYRNGVLHGMSKEFHDNGKVRKEVPYSNGKIHGMLRNYNTEEAVILEYEYKNGEKVSGGLVK